MFQREIEKSRLDIQHGSSGAFVSGHGKPSYTKPNFAKKKPTASGRKSAPMVATVDLGNGQTFVTGDKIIHDKFGEGVVVASDGENVSIAFGAEHGIKKLKAAHPAIKLRD